VPRYCSIYRGYTVKIPRQVLLELQANLRHEEMREFFRLLHRHAGHTDMRWEQVELARICTYQRRGCKLGDARWRYT